MKKLLFKKNEMFTTLILAACLLSSCNLELGKLGMNNEGETKEKSQELRIAEGILDEQRKSFRACNKMTLVDVSTLLQHASFNALVHFNFAGAQLGTEGLNMLKPSLERRQNIESFNFRSNKIEKDQLQIIAPILEKNASSLKHITLAGIKLQEKNLQIIEAAFKKMTRLEELDFSNTDLDDDGMIIFRPLLENNLYLTKLNLKHDSITYRTIAPFSAALKKLIHLQILILGQNCLFGPSYNEKLPHNPYGYTWRKGYGCIWDFTPEERDEMRTISHPNESAPVLAEAISYLHQLKEIHLEETGLSHIGLLSMANAFRSCPDLELISLDYNKIGTKGAKILASTLAGLPNLTTLLISENDIGDTGAKALISPISKLTKFHKLYISSNHISEEIMKELHKSIPIKGKSVFCF